MPWVWYFNSDVTDVRISSLRPIKNNFQFFIRFFEKRGAGGRILIFFIIYFLIA
jgi:hypothetical protein